MKISLPMRAGWWSRKNRHDSPRKRSPLTQFNKRSRTKRDEIDQQQEIKQSEVRSPSYEERVKFREELKEAVRLAGNLAGPEIDILLQQLSLRWRC